MTADKIILLMSQNVAKLSKLRVANSFGLQTTCLSFA